METFDISLVDWSRAQFALTAIYHWIFVPLTLGLSFIVAFMHTIYYKTGSLKWKSTTKFWMKLFGINFAIGVATGIILEFEFGTNWSNYSWIVGDIFGAPLAIEGILAFFIESTFIAVMFFGWTRVSKKFHMLSSWFVAIGSNLSALWILVANAWMQNPVGMQFNPDTARNEMMNFWEVIFSPTAVHKFLHTITSSYVLASFFVIGVSAWFLLKGRHLEFAKRSILIAAVFGLLSSLFTAYSGDGSAYDVAQTQPMKFAAMEGLYDGKEGVDLIAVGMLTPGKKFNDTKDDFVFALKIPKMASILAFRNANAFVPGINDLVNGNKKYKIPALENRILNGKTAIAALRDYKTAKISIRKKQALEKFRLNYKDFGYGYLPDKDSAIPNVPLTFYSFHIMVGLGFLFIMVFALILFYSLKQTLDKKHLLLKLSILMIPLAYISSELGWIVAEVGRQPWTIQDLLPTMASTSHLSTSSVQITFWLFAILFTVLLIAEIKILLHQIKLGPKEERS
ncbi:MAG: cytochrome ubiquinol oxidase subunit I [Bacteroidales bacterium]|nr:cytochrome ubiquinol oxidase subunit I [Bacteroidales bacterium]